MKKIILIAFMAFVLYIDGNSQSKYQCLQEQKIADSLYKKKSYYIGKKLSVYLNDLSFKVFFSRPDNQGNWTKGFKYYKNITIFLNCVGGFEIVLEKKVNVNLEEIKGLSWEERYEKLKILLGDEKIISFKRFGER